ncbi:uncharacterized protein H6S33_005088 [Morchella sextelata]|uniref:uncharacterized protein n=1 Tax=Morchella sextelata TaxID=1174677 RepID=UPI001D038922|nr:uncharacterized protein H6S33_005088 [Morchella sextelata]KAH0605106.1 hypothetical protein H6S33_005088 [Morchella sextelata]
MANSNSSKESHIRLAAEGAKRFLVSYDAQPMQFDVKGSCSFVLIVSGSVKYGELKEQRGFSETFVLKPVDVQPTRYLISTQGFRLVV